MPRKIGLRLDSLVAGPRQALEQAAALKMQGVEINCTQGELRPEQLDRQARKHLLHFVEDLELEIAALGGDTGFRFGENTPIELFIERTRGLFDLAADLGTRIVAAAVGTVPHEPDGPDHELVAQVLRDLGDYAANRESCLAISAGLQPPGDLRSFLDRLDNDGLRVNYDPANMVFNAYEPVESVATLDQYIVAVRARDGRRYLDGTPEELPLGEGDVPYGDLIAALDEIEYEGYFMIARPPQEDPTKDLEAARKFLERY